jgi:hypothetical protein
MARPFVVRGASRAGISRAARPHVADIGDTRYDVSDEVPFAGVAELVDARDLGSRDESRGGSSPSARTTQ